MSYQPKGCQAKQASEYSEIESMMFLACKWTAFLIAELALIVSYNLDCLPDVLDTCFSDRNDVEIEVSASALQQGGG